MSVFAQRKEKVFEVTWQNMAKIPVYLRMDGNGQPESYTAHFLSAVCSDGLCKPVDICIDWDLLGNFRDYRTPEGQPLTKFDHLPFSETDHRKLRLILSDRKSLLQDYEADDLIDRNTPVFSLKADAVTGATSPTFENAIVSGAVFTVHTLWRFVNGEAAIKIREHSLKHMEKALLTKMLRSGYVPYLHFSLEYLESHQLTETFPDELLALIRFPDDYIPHIVIRQLPERLWKEPVAEMQIVGLLDQVDVTVQNTLLNRFSMSGLSNAAIQLLLEKLPFLAERQVELTFRVLGKMYRQINAQHSAVLVKLKAHPRNIISAEAEALLRKIR